MEEKKHYCHKGTKDFRHYCHKGVETMVKRSNYLFPIFPYGKIDNRGNDDRIIDRVIC